MASAALSSSGSTSTHVAGSPSRSSTKRLGRGFGGAPVNFGAGSEEAVPPPNMLDERCELWATPRTGNRGHRAHARSPSRHVLVCVASDRSAVD
eukprot:2609750-Prymnesium_polylepis.2